MIENLPMEMRERLTEMREMDLQVQSKLCVLVVVIVKKFVSNMLDFAKFRSYCYLPLPFWFCIDYLP